MAQAYRTYIHLLIEAWLIYFFTGVYYIYDNNMPYLIRRKQSV